MPMQTGSLPFCITRMRLCLPLHVPILVADVGKEKMNAHNQARFEELTKAADKKVEAHELQDTGLAMKTTKPLMKPGDRCG